MKRTMVSGPIVFNDPRFFKLKNGSDAMSFTIKFENYNKERENVNLIEVATRIVSDKQLDLFKDGFYKEGDFVTIVTDSFPALESYESNKGGKRMIYRIWVRSSDIDKVYPMGNGNGNGGSSSYSKPSSSNSNVNDDEEKIDDDDANNADWTDFDI